MDCTILGAGGMMPMPARLTTSLLIRKNGKMIMFDAGEAIQLALKKGSLGIAALEIVAISHMHADHVLGLPGILMFRAQCDNPGPLTIVGPKGIRQFVEHTLEDLKYRINFKIRYVERCKNSESTAIEWNGGILKWEPLKHSTFCLGYQYVENERPGKFDLNKAIELNIPRGPMFGELQAGKPVLLKDGTSIMPEHVLGSPRRGRKVTYATDTMACDGLKTICEGADIAFVEGMFAMSHEKEAAQKKHSTAVSSAKIAAEAHVKKLVLVHISPRYTYDDEKILETEAKEYFKNVSVGRGLQNFEIKLPD